MIYDQPPENFVSKFEVVSCFCEYQGKILLLKRAGDESVAGGLWNVPGGQVETGEEIRIALRREVQEETGIQLAMESVEALPRLYVSYPEYDFTLLPFAMSFADEPVVVLNDEHDVFDWFTVEQALSLDLLPDDDIHIRHYFRWRRST